MPSDLWTFALRLYTEPGVEQACLHLQDSGGDVCLLLTACWLGRRGAAFDASRLDTLLSVCEPWQEEVVKPLRALRQNWRAQAQDDPALAGLREQIKALELEAERKLLARLESAADGWAEGGMEQVENWLLGCCPALEAADRDALDLLRAAALAL
ncbi:TIGR02444 family protein [Pseudomonas sp. JM0905a]|uniref:TIGR02444 family protein n=1 Tax=Metapseudomonas resinovorans TaxID=53412 RepID=A0ABT4XYC4_METRE|nr:MULTISPECIES: TIGR02444 family protein [Pseudomonas]MBD2837147.1 TIGR02444 family protein [Pseudomonas sp. JM0905a]MDA8481578.1 TIGR02444 family protein [Pseudomonas resinovorans]